MAPVCHIGLADSSPHVEYSSVVRDSHTKTYINQLEKVQRRAAGYVYAEEVAWMRCSYCLMHQSVTFNFQFALGMKPSDLMSDIMF